MLVSCLFSVWKYWVVDFQGMPSLMVLLQLRLNVGDVSWFFHLKKSILKKSIMECFVGWNNDILILCYFWLIPIISSNLIVTFLDMLSSIVSFSSCLCWKRRQFLKTLKVINLNISYTLNSRVLGIQPHLRSISGMHSQLRKNIFRNKSCYEIIWKCWSTA